ncbi:MAG: peptide-methionine (S)-S-oxide reductase MsrA [Chitinophagales bacterium]|nr:peptide-methionine (S)-S-oxide reductase MsrA [Chitinophagales bacterium]
MIKNQSLATFGGGCFWCIETIFNKLKGVEIATSGYAGGRTAHPTYEEVCDGNTGHVEVVQVAFNPDEISFVELLKVFFKIHDPTQINRQGDDIGAQYRSVIFYHTEAQKKISEELIHSLNEAKIWSDPIATKVEPIHNYFAAEAYHQNYYAQNKETNSYCALVVRPKVEKFEKVFVDIMK